MTTAESLVSLAIYEGWGARIRTWGRGTKTRCLTTWLRPNGVNGIPSKKEGG